MTDQVQVVKKELGVHGHGSWHQHGICAADLPLPVAYTQILGSVICNCYTMEDVSLQPAMVSHFCPPGRGLHLATDIAHLFEMQHAKIIELTLKLFA